ncbi:MAG: ATP-binding cassette domain-containing protein [Pirellulales bacterium]
MRNCLRVATHTLLAVLCSSSVVASTAFLTSTVAADTLGQILESGTLRWGGDASGGGPYIYQGPNNELTGFELELAEYLAAKLGVRSEFVAWEWEMLPQILDRGTIDVVLNGYEWSAERELGETHRELRRRVGMVFQQFHLFPHMNVLENVLAGPLHVLGHSRAECEVEARELLDRVGLADKLTASPDQLSGGQQQRVAIARTLAMHPEAILFDEPTSALDPRMAAEVISVITDLAQSGQTMIVVTHAMHFARNVSNTIHVMHAGRIAESGPPAAIFDNPSQGVTRDFLAQTRAT